MGAGDEAASVVGNKRKQADEADSGGAEPGEERAKRPARHEQEAACSLHARPRDEGEHWSAPGAQQRPPQPPRSPNRSSPRSPPAGVPPERASAEPPVGDSPENAAKPEARQGAVQVRAPPSGGGRRRRLPPRNAAPHCVASAAIHIPSSAAAALPH